MSELHNTNGNWHASSDTSGHEQLKKIPRPDYIDTVFHRLNPQDVEQFYKSYQLWSLQRRIDTLYIEIEAIQQAITDNTDMMQQVLPSTIELACLAQLQASGVENLDLLDRMLARGETWLDRTVQLLEQCEEMDVIQGDYTQWCEHALEGAYDWIASMDATKTFTDIPQTDPQTATEEQLLQKLMSDEDVTGKISTLDLQFTQSEPAQNPNAFPPLARKITRPLDMLETPVESANTTPGEVTLPPIEAEISPAPETPNHNEPISPIEEKMPAEIETNTTDTVMEALSVPIEEKPQTILETPLPEEIAEDASIPTTHDSELVTVSKDIDIEEANTPIEKVDETTENPVQTHITSVEVRDNKQPQLLKARHRGFWHFLRRLLRAILRKQA